MASSQLLATWSAWFLLDVTYYSRSMIRRTFSPSSGGSPLPRRAGRGDHGRRRRGSLPPRPRAGAGSSCSICGAVPGYILSVALIDVVGRRRLQVAGFLAMTLSMLALAELYEHWASHVAGFMALYNVALLLLRQRRAQHHDVRRARGALPDAVLGAFGFFPKRGAGRRRRERGRHWHPERAVRAGRPAPTSTPGHADIDSVRPGDEGRVAGGAVQGRRSSTKPSTWPGTVKL
jgi:hypothetical protein